MGISKLRFNKLFNLSTSYPHGCSVSCSSIMSYTVSTPPSILDDIEREVCLTHTLSSQSNALSFLLYAASHFLLEGSLLPGAFCLFVSYDEVVAEIDIYCSTFIILFYFWLVNFATVVS